LGGDADPRAVSAAAVVDDADPRVRAVAAAGVAGVGADANRRRCCSLSSSINSAFQLISAGVRRRLAAGSMLPYAICLPDSRRRGLSQIISLRLSKKFCLKRIQRKRSSISRAVAANGSNANSLKHRSI
jgi:hypothetical protein